MDLLIDKTCQTNFICFISLVSLLVNITYYWHNTICNSVGELTVAVIFAVILFQLSLEYIDGDVSLATTSIIF
jgi:hypothetical protein